jgi:DNA repair exonuclease SbcCD ATPase subunit
MATTQQSIDKLNKYTERLELLNKQLENVNKNTKEYKRLTAEKAQVEQKAEKASKELSNAQGKLSSTLKNHKPLIDKANDAQKRFNNTTSAGTTVTKGFFSRLKTATGTLFRYGLAYRAINIAGQIFNEITVKSVQRAIRLEKALSDVAAVANLSSGEVSRLKDTVFEVAGVTSLTALEVVELQKQLAKLGTSVTDIENLTGPVAILSQALGEEPGGVAAILKKTLNQFQATTDESNRFANVLVGAVNETALSLNDLGTALQYVGPLAAQSGVSFEQTASFLGILADNGFTASRAGTGLRNVLLESAKSGKTFSEFLEELSKRNLDVSRATDLFGKRGAAAAIVLANNTEKVKSLSEELEKSDRLFLANAKQMANTRGQLDILSSAYDKASTRLGNYITKTDIFLSLIAVFDRESAGVASAYRIIADSTEETVEAVDKLTESQRKFGDGANPVIDKAELVRQAFDAIKDTVDISKDDFLKRFNDELEKTGNVQTALTNVSGTWNGELNEAALTIKALIDLTAEQSQVQDDLYISTEANNDVVKRFNKEYAGLLDLTKDGIQVEKEKAIIQGQIETEIKRLKKETFEAAKKGDIEQLKIINKRIALLENLKTETGKLEADEETFADRKKKRLKEEEDALKRAFQERLDNIQKTLDSEIDAINAITEVELAGAKNSEEAAQIRIKQEKLTQAAYANSLKSVQELSGEFPKFADRIADVASNYEKFTKFTQSDIGAEGIGILSDYKKEFEELGKKLKDNEISLGEYAAQEDALEASLISSITTLKNSTAANQELKDMLDKVVVSYLETKKGVDDYVESTDDAVKTTKLLGKTLVQDLTIEEAIGMSLAATSDAISNFNDTALENTKARLEAEKDEIAARYETEEDILKSQLNNQLITESQYRQKQKELRKAQIAEENEIDKKIFESEKKRDRQNATTGYLQALASIIPNLIVYDKEANPIGLSIKAALSGALATAAYGAELAAISQRKFVGKKFAEGGMVNGPSHAEGGVPFSVQGRGGYEMEGGEYIVNKRATSMHRDLLERINKSGRTKATAGSYKFAEGGLVSSPLNESVDYLKAIAEATTSTAIGVSKPVRAYVADKDLRGNATERRIRDRNDRI